VAYAKQHARGVDRVSKFNLYNAMPICKELISYFAAKTTQGAQGRRGAVREGRGPAGDRGVAVVWHFNWIKWRPELVFELPIGIWLILGKELEKCLCLTHCGQGRIGWANTLGENISVLRDPTQHYIL